MKWKKCLLISKIRLMIAIDDKILIIGDSGFIGTNLSEYIIIIINNHHHNNNNTQYLSLI